MTSSLVAVPVLAGMGNALMAQPMVRQLAAGLGTRVTVLARNASIAGAFDRLDEVGSVQTFGDEPRHFATLLAALRRLGADVLVVPYPSNRWQYSLLAATSGARRVVMHAYPAGRWRAMHGLVRDRVPTRDGRHDVLTNLDLLRPLGIGVDETMAPAFPLGREEIARARERLPPGPACSVHAGSGRTVFAQSKRWPPAKFGQLVPRLRELGIAPVFVEGPEDEGVGELLRRHGDAPVLTLSGSLAEAAAVLAACRLHVGSDSGLAHLAAAVGTPPVTLFAPGRPDEVSPFGHRDLVVQTPAACSPCFRYPRHATSPRVACREPYCVDQIGVEAVVEKVRLALRPGGAGPLGAT